MVKEVPMLTDEDIEKAGLHLWMAVSVLRLAVQQGVLPKGDLGLLWFAVMESARLGQGADIDSLWNAASPALKTEMQEYMETVTLGARTTASTETMQ